MPEIEQKGAIGSITVYSTRLKVYNAKNGYIHNSFAADVKKGLMSPQKYLLPKYFYDDIGSEFFEKICQTPEYYVTRTETAILHENSDEIASLNSAKKVMVELGSGSSVKTRYLIKSFLNNHEQMKYMPVDVSEIMISGSEELLNGFEGLKVDGILAEYETGIQIANSAVNEPKMIVFLGSSIGNFDLHEALDFIKMIASNMGPEDSLLIGFDLVKDINVLNEAYNDAQGYTAGFNLNHLERINRELSGEFDLRKFRHNAFFNQAESRMEMHLVSTVEQDICVHGIWEKIHFDKGETIHTENSYKFTDKMIADLASHAGLMIEKVWKDEKDYFALCMMRKVSS